MSGGPPQSKLKDVRYGRIERHEDARGSFRELWRASRMGDFGADLAGLPHASFVQANLSASASGVLRGLHLHRRQLDYWVIGSGRAFVALVDAREMISGIASAPEVETRELGADEWVLIPIGVAHGFLALEPLEMIYLVTNEYDGSDELGFAWNDALADVHWPIVHGTPDGEPILSERDRSNPSLAELVSRLRTTDPAGRWG